MNLEPNSKVLYRFDNDTPIKSQPHPRSFFYDRCYRVLSSEEEDNLWNYLEKIILGNMETDQAPTDSSNGISCVGCREMLANQSGHCGPGGCMEDAPLSKSSEREANQLVELEDGNT
jgi:hypothetical protein